MTLLHQLIAICSNRCSIIKDHNSSGGCLTLADVISPIFGDDDSLPWKQQQQQRDESTRVELQVAIHEHSIVGAKRVCQDRSSTSAVSLRQRRLESIRLRNWMFPEGRDFSHEMQVSPPFLLLLFWGDVKHKTSNIILNKGFLIWRHRRPIEFLIAIRAGALNGQKN